MYPRLVIDINKLKSNLDAVAHITKDQGGCSLMIVTKGLCADKEMVHMVAQHPAVDFVADSRVKNIRTYAEEVRKNGKNDFLRPFWRFRSLKAEVIHRAKIITADIPPDTQFLRSPKRITCSALCIFGNFPVIPA